MNASPPSPGTGTDCAFWMMKLSMLLVVPGPVFQETDTDPERVNSSLRVNRPRKIEAFAPSWPGSVSFTKARPMELFRLLLCHPADAIFQVPLIGLELLELLLQQLAAH